MTLIILAIIVVIDHNNYTHSYKKMQEISNNNLVKDRCFHFMKHEKSLHLFSIK